MKQVIFAADVKKTLGCVIKMRGLPAKKAVFSQQTRSELLRFFVDKYYPSV
ncbi:MAG: hypothetical protein WBM35_11900 [Candidatus Electrothrix sp.]